MRRANSAVWFLLFLQLVPVFLMLAGASGILDPLGQLVVSAIRLPAPGERAGFLINLARFVSTYWFVGCAVLTLAGSLLAVVYVAFDRAQTKLERLAWAI